MNNNDTRICEDGEYKALFYETAHAELAGQGQALLSQPGKADEAIGVFQQLLAIYPNHEFLWNALGSAFFMKHEYQSALNCYLRTVSIMPDRVAFIFNVHRAYLALDRPGDAAVFVAGLLESKKNNSSDYFELLCRLADALRENGQFEESIKRIEEAQQINPTHPGCDWSKGQNLLLLGRYKEGWQYYETRYRLPTDKLPRRDFGCPKWLGELVPEQIDITGKTILVHDEQGFGDTMMAGRYLRLLKEKIGAQGKLILQIKDPLHRLFEESGVDMIISVLQTAGKGNIPQPDYHTLVMSLPGAFGATPENLPPPLKVHIPESSRRKFKFISENCPADVVKIGIVWSGSNNWDDNHKRGLPLDVFLRLAENRRHRIYSLQKDVHAGDLYMKHADTYIEDLGKLCDDFADTAAAIEQMDLIIMTDTSVAHLAGSMGKRVINLVQRLPYWIYWFNNKTSTPWYPSMELKDRNNYGDFFEQDFSVMKK